MAAPVREWKHRPTHRPRWLQKRRHRHLMNNFSCADTMRYCVAGLWDRDQGKFVSCPFTDQKAR